MKKANINKGDRYGRLTIIQEVEKRGNFRFFECKCDCGAIKILPLYSLRKGVTKSCGCLHRELNRLPKANRRTENYGFVGSRLYNIWVGMRKRCYTSTSRAYKYYGGRGICICEDWTRFIVFMNWAINNGYRDNLTIDRIDVNGNYTPNNCRWITIQEQQKNKRK
jgi:hypothetical protein